MNNSSTRFFQWLAGERRGEIVYFNSIVEEDGIVYVTFKDGSRVNSELIAEINQRELNGHVMAEIEGPHNAWSFKERESASSKPRIEQDWESQIKYEVPTIEEMAHADLTGESGVVKPIPKRKIIDLVPPRATRNKFGKIANTEDMAEQYNKTVEVKTPVDVLIDKVHNKVESNLSNDPVYILLSKAKKVDSEITMGMLVSLPPKSLYDIAKASFDEGDEKFINYIVNEIEVDEIKNALKIAIREMYEDDTPSNDI